MNFPDLRDGVSRLGPHFYVGRGAAHKRVIRAAVPHGAQHHYGRAHGPFVGDGGCIGRTAIRIEHTAVVH
jgi:hypothetical protein